MQLADLLTALAVVGLVLSAAVSVFAQGQRAYVQGAARVESQQNARIALMRMAREIRQAGSSPNLAPLAVAEPARLVLQHDADGDGVATARGETVTWQLSAGVLRRNAGAGLQPIINGVRALDFTYLDTHGRPTTALADVRTVVITLTTFPEYGASRGADTRLTTQVRLRNR